MTVSKEAAALSRKMYAVMTAAIEHRASIELDDILKAATILSANAVQIVRANLCEECFRDLMLNYDVWHAEMVAEAIRRTEPRPVCSTEREDS